MKRRGRPDATLRQRAEERLATSRSSIRQRLRPEDSMRLVHELEVHQHELEIQNEQLQAARNELEDALGRYTAVFDFAPIGYLVLETDGTIRKVNLEAARMLGRPRDEAIGRPAHQFVHSAEQGYFLEFLGRVATARKDERERSACELSLGGEGRESLQVRLVGSHLAERPPRALVAMFDVTLLKRAEAVLLEEAHFKDDFLAALSHELRNPLAPIRNAVTLLEHEHLGERGQKALAIVDRQADQLVRIVDDLLDVTRITRGKIVLERERLELGELVRHAVDDHAPIFHANGIALEVHVPAEPLWVDADRTRLVEVVGNLLVNALKFTQGGGRVDIVLRPHGRAVILSVCDSGAGIAPDVLKRLFQPFTQGPQGLARSRGGLGLGLAMVKGLVELHGGSVVANSAGLGRGSQFVVRLPLAGPPARHVEHEPVHLGTRRRVLVIEDNEDTSDSLRELLMLDGHDVEVAHDGPTGLLLAKEFRPDVVLCDIGLPGMDGYEVARAMRREPSLQSSRLVALSGYALPEDRRRSMDAGFDRHLAKPPSTSDLQHVIAETH